MRTAKIFSNGSSQAVRLPKDCRFSTDKVMVARMDGMVILYPRKAGWDLLRQGIERFTGDFMKTRKQPRKMQVRAKF